MLRVVMLSLVMLSVIMTNVIMLSFIVVRHYVEWYFTECRYAQCHAPKNVFILARQEIIQLTMTNIQSLLFPHSSPFSS
jgi:hypothetical protein